MKRIELALMIGVCFSLLLASFSGFGRECDEVRHEVVRLHILANSDSEADQALKLAVRDAVLEETAGLFTGSATKEQAQSLAAGHLREIEEIAAAEIRRQGYSYGATARVVNRYFDTREYDGFTMPAGHYDAVQIEIGGGDGQNWWCVMFPPLCIPAASEQDDTPLEERIRTLGEPPQYKPAFAIVEAIEDFQHFLDGEKD